MILNRNESDKKALNNTGSIIAASANIPNLDEISKKKSSVSIDEIEIPRKYKKAYDALIYDEKEFLDKMEKMEKIGTFDSNIEFPKYYLLPKGKFKIIWDGVILILCLYSVLLIPMEIGMFLLYNLEINNLLTMYLSIEYIISLCLFIDLIFHFLTPIYTTKGDLILDYKKIMKEYFHRYFTPDLLSIIPLDFILNPNLDITSFYTLLVLKIPRFLRFIKIFRHLFKFKNSVLKIARMFFIYYLVAHFFSCAICYTDANISAGYNLTKTSITLFISTQSLATLYTKYVYLSFLILIGNNQPPDDFRQRIIFVIMFYVGTLCDAIMFGNMAIIFTKTNQLEKNKNRKDDDLNSLLNILGVNRIVQNEIIDYQDIIWWKHRDVFFSKKFVIELNKCLQRRINIIKLSEQFFDKSAIFENFSHNFIINFVSKIKHVITHPNDILTFEGSLDQNHKLYFISKDGKFSVRINGNIIKILSQGDFFGEIAYFLKCQRRIATVVSMNISMLYYLDYTYVNELFMDYPHEGKEFFNIAFTRFKETLMLMDEELKKKILLSKKESIWVDDILQLLENIKKEELVR